MKILIIICWVVMIVAIVFYFVAKYRLKKKNMAIVIEQLSQTNLSLDELQELLDERGVD